MDIVLTVEDPTAKHCKASNHSFPIGKISNFVSLAKVKNRRLPDVFQFLINYKASNAIMNKEPPMFEAKELSRVIRAKKNKTRLRPDLDDAGQDSLDPNEAWDAKQDAEVNTTLGNPDHEPASDAEMGENDSSQDKKSLARAMKLINSYFSKMMLAE